ncbi:MAG: putative endonuclease [Arenicella sp.]|jgi:putative endonuclease
MPKPGLVYIILCKNDTLYTGSTIDLSRRLKEHINGSAANYTKKYPPIKLLYTEEFEHIAIAFKREKQIQRWSQSKKWALINGNKAELERLSECANSTHHKNFKLNTSQSGNE